MRTKHFKDSEFQCNCGRCEFSKESQVKQELLTVLELARFYVKNKNPKSYLKITSGRRCEAYNKKVGGSDKSQHKLGTAADIQPAFYSSDDLAELYRFLCKTFPSCYGFGLYSNFIHIDVRKDKARWQE